MNKVIRNSSIITPDTQLTNITVVRQHLSFYTVLLKLELAVIFKPIGLKILGGQP